MRKDLESTAYHEAGHAVMDYLFRTRLLSITIEPSTDTEGQCSFGGTGPNFQPEFQTGHRTRVRLEAIAMRALGGAVAQELFTGRRPVRSSWRSDRENAMDAISYLTGDNRELEAYLTWLLVRTEAALRSPLKWQMVTSLAQSLLDRPTLTGHEARAIIRSAADRPLPALR